MKASLSLLIFLITFHGSFFIASPQADSCTSKLNLKTPIAFDTTKLQCVSVWSAQGFILRVRAPCSHFTIHILLTSIAPGIPDVRNKY